jgi:hypothetical protein
MNEEGGLIVMGAHRRHALRLLFLTVQYHDQVLVLPGV